MEMATYDEGVPSWVDLGTSDIGKAARFYGASSGGKRRNCPSRPAATGCARCEVNR